MLYNLIFDITVDEILPKNGIYSTNDSIKVHRGTDNSSIVYFMYSDLLNVNLPQLVDMFISSLIKSKEDNDVSVEITVRISENSKSLVNIPSVIFDDIKPSVVVDLQYKSQINAEAGYTDPDEDDDEFVDIDCFMGLLDNYGDPDDYDEECDDDDDDSDEDGDEPDFDDIFGSFGVNFGDSRKGNKRGGSKERYQQSKVFSRGKSKKDNIKNHGILIANKDHIEHDRKIVKRFLKDFIPGDSKYIQEYRKRVLKRWMSMYALSKKQANEIEKDFRKKYNKRRINTSDVISQTSRNILRNYSAFYDVNK